MLMSTQVPGTVKHWTAVQKIQQCPIKLDRNGLKCGNMFNFWNLSPKNDAEYSIQVKMNRILNYDISKLLPHRCTCVKNVGTQPMSQRYITSISRNITPTVQHSSNSMTNDISNSPIQTLPTCCYKCDPEPQNIKNSAISMCNVCQYKLSTNQLSNYYHHHDINDSWQWKGNGLVAGVLKP